MTGAVRRLTAAAASGFVVFLLSMPVAQGRNGWRVTYTSAQICALEGSTVEIRCTYTYPSTKNPATTVEQRTWSTRTSNHLRADSEYAGRVRYYCEGNNCTLRIADVRDGDSAVYMFRLKINRPDQTYIGSPGVTLSVTDLQVQVIRSISQEGGMRTELKCHSSCHPDQASYIWYKNGQKIQEATSSYLAHIHPADSYSCALKGHEDFPSPSKCVGGQSCNRVAYTHRSICAFRGSSVDISCTYSSHSDDVTSKFWFSPDRSRQWQNPSQPEDLREDSQYAGRVQVLETEGGRSTLRITDLTESDSAQYHFKFRAGSFEWRSSLPGTTLTVIAPDLQVLIKTSSSSWWSKLTCLSSCHLQHHSSYRWYLNGQHISGQTSVSYPVNLNQRDSYSCALRGREDVPSPPVCVRGQTCYRVTYTHRSICAVKGSSVDISCTYSSHVYYVTSNFWFNPDRSHQWKSPSQPEDLRKDSHYAGRVQVKTEGGRSTLRITNLTDSDSAQYHFKFRAGSFEWKSSLPGTTLTVTALQVQVTRRKVHQFYTQAELKCHSSCGPAGQVSYIWFNNGVKIMTEESSSYKDQFYPGDNISCALKGHETFISPSLHVLKPPSVSVSPSGDIMEGSSVTLNCSSDANPAANYTWYKENVNVKALSEEAQLVFRSIQSSDSGEYYCAAENELGRRTSQHISINVT
ncbi:uncharacterized protein LOC143319034 [Chaetodon auriga]|uniref:uncharacterized protein LOC143319034 n=1 Tax=Chaetodon auriga TaxID=39042 RepID=UPI004032B725